jgi:GNAT superfamily N-acetyltransferase
MPINLAQLEIHDVDHGRFDLAAFDCDDGDLNEFIKVDCIKYKAQNLSHTRVALYNGRVVGYIALLADSITLEESERQWLIHKNVKVHQIPALKVGRLGIQRDFQKQGVGSSLMKYAAGVAFRMNSEIGVGCRFITLDAYPKSIDFYQKIGFVKSMHKTYKTRKFPSMHYDIVSGPPIPG